MHQDYLAVTQMGGGVGVPTQNFPAQSPNAYSTMATVIQHRMSGSGVGGNHGAGTVPGGNAGGSGTGGGAVHNPLPSPHQRLGPSPSSCAISGNNNFYIQGNVSHSTSHTPIPVPTPTPTPSATPTLQINQSVTPSAVGGAGSSAGNGGGQSNAGQVCSLSKLQQLTNGLDMIQPCNTPPSGSINLTPPPNHHPHNTMTPPPSHLVQQNRNLATPPSLLQSQMSALQYPKYYSSNMNVTPPIPSQNTGGRTARNTASAPVQHMTAGTSRVSPNVTISPNLMSPYGSLNGYRMAAQQSGASVASYITNSAAAAGFINNPAQLPVQMGVMNMQSQYQDPAALQRAAQQNSMYSTYPPYIPLNGTMRR